jgi:ABC-type uncharacterized transport system permease subunit
MLSNLMKTVGAFLTGLGGVYVGQHIAGELSFWAFIAFALGVVLLSQAPTIALRERVRALEAKPNGGSSVEHH